MKYITLAVALLTTLVSSSQINFDPGYYVDNTGNRISGYIKNLDWLTSPKQITFKDNLNADGEIITINDAREFGLEEGATYTRHSVQIDFSSNNLGNLSMTRAPQFEEKTLFLKNRLDGKATLYEYRGEGVQRFFLSLDSGPLQQLVYKRFSNKKGKYGVNEYYKQQLKELLDCNKFTDNSFTRLEYKGKDLLKIVEEYNACSGESSVIYNSSSAVTKNENLFKLRLKLGARNNDFQIINQSTVIDFDGAIGLQAGIEGEFIFAFNRNKWSALADFTYFSYRDEKESTNSILTRNNMLDYSAVEFNVGARHSFFINDNARFFLNANFIVPFNLNQSLDQGVGTDYDEFVKLGNIGFGGGFEWKNLSLNLLFQGERTLINGPINKYNSFSASVGYVLF